MKNQEILDAHPPCDPIQIWNTLQLIPGLNLYRYVVDIDDFQNYLKKARYPRSYRNTFGELFIEKALEHYTSIELMGYNDQVISIDIASSTSPYHAIISNFYSCKSYHQDLIYPPGIHDLMVGGNATDLPFEDHSISRMTLHCSIEHFENDEDSKFIVEAIQKLTIGGKLFIAPLYLAEVYYNCTDPDLKVNDVIFDRGAKILPISGWNNRFGRTYDVGAFQNRVLAYCKGVDVSMYFVENVKDVCSKCYLKFIFILEKTNNRND